MLVDACFLNVSGLTLADSYFLFFKLEDALRLGQSSFSFSTLLIQPSCLQSGPRGGADMEVEVVVDKGIIHPAILQRRMYLLYSQNRAVVAFMLVPYIATTIVTGWAAGSNMRLATSFAITIQGEQSACQPVALAWFTYGQAITPLVYEAVLCMRILIRAYQKFTAERSSQHGGRVLIQVLIRDSVLYYFILAFTYLACLLVWLKTPLYLDIPANMAICFSCVLGGRMILNLREAASVPMKNHLSEREIENLPLSVFVTVVKAVS
ncbi:hypothetical protein CPC08DRAFT_769170 [Agrocybe pediades]|nr:hypothetical protein CPC08DRAFT_769170 [Agrocybe pediades]